MISSAFDCTLSYTYMAEYAASEALEPPPPWPTRSANICSSRCRAAMRLL